MRSKLVLAALIILSTLPVFSQVAPAAKIGGLPLGVGVGFVNFDTDYYKPDIRYWNGRLAGISGWGDYSVFHGLGVEVEGASVFAGTVPVTVLHKTSLKETTIQGGIIYRYHPVFKVRPFVKGLGGIGKIDFPSTNPRYQSEHAGLYTVGGGLEYRVWRNLMLRGQYEQQWWTGFRPGAHQSLDPAGFTIGATYYLRGIHRHY